MEYTFFGRGDMLSRRAGQTAGTDRNGVATGAVMTEARQHSAVAVVLAHPIVVVTDLTWPRFCFRRGDERFVHTLRGDWTGFYDWLRDSRRRVIGLRYRPFEEVHFILNEIEPGGSVRVTEATVECLFDEGARIDASQSGDQAFQYVGLFESSEGHYALLVDTEELTDKKEELDLSQALTETGFNC